jgi:hypothetical protein
MNYSNKKKTSHWQFTGGRILHDDDFYDISCRVLLRTLSSFFILLLFQQSTLKKLALNSTFSTRKSDLNMILI